MATTNKTQTITTGTRVEAGEGEDRDTGTVLAIDGNRAQIGWDSGVRTWAPVADLTITSESHSGGKRIA